jgi:hypothetical protein
LSGAAGLFNLADTRSLQLTAIAALVLETIALGLLVFQKPAERVEVSKN